MIINLSVHCSLWNYLKDNLWPIPFIVYMYEFEKCVNIKISLVIITVWIHCQVHCVDLGGLLRWMSSVIPWTWYLSSSYQVHCVHLGVCWCKCPVLFHELVNLRIRYPCSSCELGTFVQTLSSFKWTLTIPEQMIAVVHCMNFIFILVFVNAIPIIILL